MFGHTNDHKQTEPIIHAHPTVDAISPPVDVASARQIALAPYRMFLNPSGLEPADSVGRQATGLLPQQGAQRFLKVASRHSLQVQPGNKLINASGALQIRRQQTAVELDAAEAADTDFGHPDLHTDYARLDGACWQISVANHSLMTLIRAAIGKLFKKIAQLGLHRPGNQVACSIAQQLVERIIDIRCW